MKSLFTSAITLAAPTTSQTALASSQPAAAATRGRARQAALGFLLMGSVFCANAALAQQQPVVVDKADAVTFRVRTQNPAQQRVQVQVVSTATGQQLFAETHKQAYYARRLSFQKLNPGYYILTAKLGQDSYRYAIRVKKPTAAGGQSVAVHKVRIRLGNESPQLEVLNTLAPAVVPAIAIK